MNKDGIQIILSKSKKTKCIAEYSTEKGKCTGAFYVQPYHSLYEVGPPTKIGTIEMAYFGERYSPNYEIRKALERIEKKHVSEYYLYIPFDGEKK